MKKIYIASDHAGFKLKTKLKESLPKNKISFEDLGAFQYNKKDDYPLFAFKLSEKVKKKKSKGILICSSGQGICIAANKIKGIYAALVYDIKSARHAKEDLDSNVICISADHTNLQTAIKIIKAWMKSNFKKGRHTRRINEIKKIERGNLK